MMIICREVDKETGKIAVYPIEAEVTDQLIFNLGIRARINPELQYYATTKAHFAGLEDVILAVLKRKRLTETDIARVGGLVLIS